LNKLEALLIRRYLGVDAAGSIKLNAGDGPRLIVAPELREEVAILKGLMRFYVYGHSALVAQQYGQRQIVKRLFEILFDSSQPGSRHSRIIPAPFDESMKSINDADTGAVHQTERVRLVMDIIASMTEQQTVAFHQRLTGTSPGSILDKIIKS
jgi:dGTPase